MKTSDLVCFILDSGQEPCLSVFTCGTGAGRASAETLQAAEDAG